MNTNQAQQIELDFNGSQDAVLTKACSKCKRVLPHAMFYKLGRASEKLRPRCKDCNGKSKMPTCAIDPKKKVCSRCQRVLPRAKFYPISGKTERLRSHCKDCNRASERALRAKDPEKYDRPKREWKQQNPDRARAIMDKWREANPEIVKANCRRSYERNKHKAPERWAKNKQNPDFLTRKQDQRRRHRARHLEEIRHKEHAKTTRRRGAKGRHTLQEWRELCEKYGNCCLRCGVVGKVTKDHVIPLIQGGTDYISNLQPLCLSCNCSKKDKFIDYRPKEPVSVT